jgi:hypothetical protein
MKLYDYWDLPLNKTGGRKWVVISGATLPWLENC